MKRVGFGLKPADLGTITAHGIYRPLGPNPATGGPRRRVKRAGIRAKLTG